MCSDKLDLPSAVAPSGKLRSDRSTERGSYRRDDEIAMSRWVEATGDSLVRRLSWTSLLAVLVGLLFFSLLFQRPVGQQLPGEATRLMAAESLAFDGDLLYSRRDFDRHVLTWLDEPSELTLASSSGGRHITYGVSPAYSVWLAPFLRGWPRHGFAIANCLLLLLIGVACAALWQRSRGALGPFHLGICLFASLLFCTPFLADGGLLAALATLLAFSLISRSHVSPEMIGRRFDGSGVLAGVLLALPASDLWLHGVLLVAAIFMVEGRQRWFMTGAFLAGLGLLAIIPWWAGGGFEGLSLDSGDSYQTMTFEPASGFPLVDFEAEEWAQRVEKLEQRTIAEPEVSAGLRLGGNALLDRLLGRRLGLVTFFPLIIPLFVAACWIRRRRPLAMAVVMWLVALVWLHPFDVEVGGALWAGGRCLPIYAALVGCLGRPTTVPLGGRWLIAAWGIGLALATWTLPEVWRSPWRAPLALAAETQGSGEELERSRFLRSGMLPFESTQARRLRGDRVAVEGITWINLDGQGWMENHQTRLVLPIGRASSWMLVSAEPLDIERLSSEPSGELLKAMGLRIEEPMPARQVDIEWRLAASVWGHRRHDVGWTSGPQWLYRLQAVPRVAMEDSEDPPLYLVLQPATLQAVTH